VHHSGEVHRDSLQAMRTKAAMNKPWDNPLLSHIQRTGSVPHKHALTRLQVQSIPTECLSSFHAATKAYLSYLQGEVGDYQRELTWLKKEMRKRKKAAGTSSQSAGGVARATKLTPERKSEIASLAAKARWSENDKASG